MGIWHGLFQRRTARYSAWGIFSIKLSVLEIEKDVFLFHDNKASCCIVIGNVQVLFCLNKQNLLSLQNLKKKKKCFKLEKL